MANTNQITRLTHEQMVEIRHQAIAAYHNRQFRSVIPIASWSAGADFDVIEHTGIMREYRFSQNITSKLWDLQINHKLP